MAIFQQQARKEGGSPRRGDDFLSAAKDTLTGIFEGYADKAAEMNSIDEYNGAVLAELWPATEELLKSSYRNGVRAGQAIRSRKAK